jgi:alpha-glucosidase
MNHDNLIIYQLMPDRFARATGEQPSFANLEMDSTPGKGNPARGEFFGGSLNGLCERLDHIRDLGANTILLTPILKAPSYHRYDSTNFKQLDERLGTDADLDRLIESAHRMGLKLICDLPLNHISDRHPWFVEAQANRQSPKADFFTFLPEGGHLGWWGNQHFPELNLQNETLRRELWASPESVVDCWLGRGFDGIRLDCANDLTMPVCRSIKHHMESRFPRALLMGEVSNFATPWAQTLALTQSYWFSFNLGSLFKKTISPRQFMMNMAASYEVQGGAGQMQMLSSHDTERSDTQFGSSPAFLKAARRMQFLLPGVPMIYSGEEFAMKGGRDPLNRAPTPWGNLGRSTVKKRMGEIRELSAIRTNSPELSRGRWKPLLTENEPNLMAFLSFLEKEPWEFSIVTWNASAKPLKTLISVPYEHLYSTTRLEESFSKRTVETACGFMWVELAPWECCHWRLKEGNKGSYRFYKRWAIEPEAQ